MCHNPVLCLLAPVALVFVLIYIGARASRRKRREALQQLALSTGYDFDPEAAAVPQQLLSVLPFFLNGDSRKSSNLLSRSSGSGQTLVFDYYYATGSGKNRTQHSQTAAVFHCQAFLPQFQLCPENLAHKFLKLFGYSDINFPESSEFSKMYLLRGPDENAVRAQFTLDARTLMQGLPGWRLEAAGQWLLAYKPGGLRKPEEYASYLEQARSIAAALGLRGMP